jgi:signal transduction histidine kinase
MKAILKKIDIKFKIAMIIALLLVVAMTLLDMVMVFAAQQLLIKAERQKAGILIDSIGARMTVVADGGASGVSSESMEEDDFLATLSDANVAMWGWLNSRGEMKWIQGIEKSADVPLKRMSQLAMNRQQLQAETSGTTWGIFWRQKKYLSMAGPIYRNGRMAGVAGVTICLDSLYSKLRDVQKFIGIYLLINTVILTFLGIFRIHHIALRPISKIIGRAEAFRPGDAEFQLEENGENELSRLSRSINRVFDLNREDQEKLRETVAQLEEAMAQLKQAQQEVVRAEKLATVGRLSSGVAHEIGNPIGIVMGYLELIKQAVGEGDEEVTDYIRRAENEVGRIRSVIRQLLDYSRPTEEHRKPVSVHEVLEDTLQMVRIQPLFMEIAVAKSLDAGNCHVTGDRSQLKQLFLNFLLNSADAIKMSPMETAGRIHIRSRNAMQKIRDGEAPRETVIVDFEDNGPGISEADLNHIFDPFFTTKPPGKGSGLGLWVSLLISEAMGGTIKVHTGEGDGTRMALVLPVVGGEGPDDEKKS